MDSNEICQSMRITENQFSRICRHLRISVSAEVERVFTPREVERIQFFVSQKRSAKKKNKLATRQNAQLPEVSSTDSNSEQVTPQESLAVSAPVVESASVGLRACAYVIDCLFTLILGPFVIVPILGPMLIGVLLFLYWLLRDVGGASPGKLILGLQVKNNSGDPNRVGPRIIRNILFSIAPLLFCIPVVGLLIGAPIAILVVLLETVMLLVTGKRVGEILADTSVKIIPKVQTVTESN